MTNVDRTGRPAVASSNALAISEPSVAAFFAVTTLWLPACEVGLRHLLESAAAEFA